MTNHESGNSLTIILIRHAEAAPPRAGTGAEGERDRLLTERGLHDAEALAETLAAMKPDRVYSSLYRRAIQSVAPIANRHGMNVELIENLRERLLSPGPLPDFREHLERCRRDFDYAPAGDESNAVAQARVGRGVRGAQAPAWRRRRGGWQSWKFDSHLLPNPARRDFARLKDSRFATLPLRSAPQSTLSFTRRRFITNSGTSSGTR